jgi:hypothetical protein
MGSGYRVRAAGLALGLGLGLAACVSPDAGQEFPTVRTVAIGTLSAEELFPDPDVRRLAVAAASGKLGELQHMVDTGVDVNSRGTGDATPLFFAMKNPEGFERLLKLGADPNLLLGGGRLGGQGSVLHVAARTGNRRALELALKHGGNPNLLASDGSMVAPPLFAAVGSPELLGVLLAAGAKIDAPSAAVVRSADGTTEMHLEPDPGRTAVYHAALEGQLDSVEFLLQRGASFKVATSNNETLVDVMVWLEGRVPAKREPKRRGIMGWLREHGAPVPR